MKPSEQIKKRAAEIFHSARLLGPNRREQVLVEAILEYLDAQALELEKRLKAAADAGAQKGYLDACMALSMASSGR